MAGRGGRHHGEAIRAYRLQVGLTQAQLAAQWPGGPVNPQYVQRVETGKKHIADQETLRRLAALLDIPLWRFGLSEYDPFAPHNLPGAGLHMYAQTLDAVECLVQSVWSLRVAALLPEAEQCLRRLNALFTHFRRELPPPARLEARYLRLHAQVVRLNAVVAVEGKQYPAALALYARMRALAEQLGEPATLALALMSTGAELERAGRKREAVDWLERARDVSFGASKQVAAFVNSYLARAYASAGDEPRFMRAAETARTLALHLGERYGDGTDFIYARPSSVLAEQSWGWLELRTPHKTLELRGEIAAQIEHDGDRRLYAWIPLDWARAHLAQGEVEAALAEAGEFAQRAEAMGSPHALRHVGRFVAQVEAAGHAGLLAVRGLRERYGAMSKQTP
jgi:transcriptional regulator with XRE-family HTH domain